MQRADPTVFASLSARCEPIKGLATGGGAVPGVPVTPLYETFYFLNEIRKIFRWQKGANLKNFQYFGSKNHGQKAHLDVIRFVSKYSRHDDVVSILV